MKIWVCPLSKVGGVISLCSPGSVISLLDPASPFPELGPTYVGRHLRLIFHDIHAPARNRIMPTAEHIRLLLRFIAAWDTRHPLLIHCRAGIGRSTAAAYIAACARNPDSSEHDIAIALRRAAPLARPNETLIHLADRELGRSGRMRAAIAATGRDLPTVDVREGQPFCMSLMQSPRVGPA